MRGKFGVLACGALCGVAALALPAVAGAAGFAGPRYQDTSGAPTTSKPESKLWFHDGKWWASMHNGRPGNAGGAYTIHRLNMRTQRWVNTGIIIDTRDSTRQDALSVGSKLFIASHKYQGVARHKSDATSPDGMKLHGFSYNNAQNEYTRLGSHDIDLQRAESLAIDRDSDGRIWATWVQQSASGDHQVYVKNTNLNCATTGGFGSCAFVNAGILDPQVGDDDISSIIRFGGNKIGVMWSDTPSRPGRVPEGTNTDTLMEFAVHLDGEDIDSWAVQPATNASVAKLAEDHINLKAAGETVYAAMKTKYSHPSNPGIRLLVRTPSGNWSGHEVTNAGFRHTRPIVVITGSRVRVFSQGGSDVFMKTARRSTLNFSGGAGTRVMDAGDPTSTKQNLTGTTQMIVLGSNDAKGVKRYWHTYTQLSRCVRSGSVGNDRICGNRLNNRLKGLAGNDVILGGRGNDRLVGGPGRDRLIGGPGRDTFIARDGTRDVLKGGSGRDRARVDGLDRRRSIERLF